jgi:dTMP kinase
MSGIFITLEGIDGCGKSTQARMLAALLTEHSIPHLITREPGGTEIGNQIRNILLSGSNSGLVATAELLLYAADRAQHVQEMLLPALDSGQVVLCDRYTDATMAYQGYGRGLSFDLIEELNRLATDNLIPDLTLLFDLDVGQAQSRVGAGVAERGIADRLDSETSDFHERVRVGYLELARRYPERYRLIPASGSAQEVFKLAFAAVNPLIRVLSPE